MNSTIKKLLLVSAISLLAFGCDEEGDPDAGVDAGGTDSGTADGGDDAPTCEMYCDNVLANCTGANASYADRDECLDICANAGWAAGDPVTVSGPASGNSIGCRTYHSGGPAGEDPDTHCPHAGETGADTCGGWCENYCDMAMAVCTGANAIYGSEAECMTACAGLDDAGDLGATDGDTLQCRFYHLGVAIRDDDPVTHCPHAAEDGGGVCVGGWPFNTTDPGDYTRVDRMGMPAISTAVISSGMKNAYNDASPTLDAAGTFVADINANIDGLHTALDDDLNTAGLSPCDSNIVPALNECVSQAAPLVVPDTLKIDPTTPAGFPNGRLLADPVIDVTLSAVLLDWTFGTQGPTTLADLPLNPPENDLEFSTDFPYLAAPHTP